jgi:glycosyltransferase involved in cell wall biosynthesis
MPRVSTIVLITGDIDALRDDAVTLLRAMRWFIEQRPDGDDFQVMIDGPRWQAALPGELLAGERQHRIVLDEACHLPARLANTALANIDSDFVSFLWPGAEVSTWFANKAELIKAADERKANVVAGYRGPGERRELPTQSHLAHADDGLSPDCPRAWLQMLDLAPMANAVVRTAWLKQVGGFSEAALLQRAFWWDFCLRAAADRPIENIPQQPIPVRSWHRFPFEREWAAPVDIAVRVMMAAHGERGRTARIDDAEARQMLARDFAPSTVKRTLRGQGATDPLPDIPADPLFESLPPHLRERLAGLRENRPLRIAVLGGVNEPAHNQLCFFNYFELMRHWGILSWRSLLDIAAHPADLAQCDLVIFSRVRSANGVALMEFCRTNDIPTLYMLDDNWFWLGREWPEYADLFLPGRPDYERFLSCMMRADTVLTYNETLAGDMRSHARQLVVLPTNVDLTFFDMTYGTDGDGKNSTVRAEPVEAQGATTHPLTIGYVGSIRKNLAPFEALVEIVEARPDVHLFVMSNKLPDELQVLPAERITFRPYQFNYAGYAKTVCAARPDVLVAPIGDTRFEASKCPNKFLEISACGAAGVYSRTEPYLSHVREGETGLFAGEDVADWREQITRLIDDAELRSRIQSQSLAAVKAGYDTRAVLPSFLDMLLDAVRVPA